MPCWIRLFNVVSRQWWSTLWCRTFRDHVLYLLIIRVDRRNDVMVIDIDHEPHNIPRKTKSYKVMKYVSRDFNWLNSWYSEMVLRNRSYDNNYHGKVHLWTLYTAQQCTLRHLLTSQTSRSSNLTYFIFYPHDTHLIKRSKIDHLLECYYTRKIPERSTGLRFPLGSFLRSNCLAVNTYPGYRR